MRIPAGHTPAEAVLVRLLKPELMDLLDRDARDLWEERAGILEHQAGFPVLEAERLAGVVTNAK